MLFRSGASSKEVVPPHRAYRMPAGCMGHSVNKNKLLRVSEQCLGPG